MYYSETFKIISEKLFIAGRIQKMSNKLSKKQEKERRLKIPFLCEFVKRLYYQQKKD